MVAFHRFSFIAPVGALVAAFLVAAPAGAQHAGHTQPPAKADQAKAEAAHEGHDEDHAKSGWKELDTFHNVMAASWHPAKKDSLGPARAQSAELVSAAKTWAASTAPKGCDAPEVSSAIARLVPETEAVAGLVTRQADDATLKAALKTVHDTFHVAEEGCKPAKPSGHNGHH